MELYYVYDEMTKTFHLYKEVLFVHFHILNYK